LSAGGSASLTRPNDITCSPHRVYQAPTTPLPEWLSPSEQSLVQTILLKNEGVSLSSSPSSLQHVNDYIDSLSPTVIMMGDATHGTEEFYQIRSALTKALLDDDSFAASAVLIEGDVAPFIQINRHVLNDDTPMRKFPKQRFPTWMWDNNVTRDFIEWLRKHNSGRSKKTHLMGMDIFCLFESMDDVIEYLERIGHDDAYKARQCYESLLSFRPDPKMYAQAVFNDEIESQEHNVKSVMEILERLRQGLDKKNAHTNVDKGSQLLELFYSLQNARAIVAGEAYFRLSSSDPVAMWNLRDKAFLETIENTISFLKESQQEEGNSSMPVRLIVWAHNSHVGDVRATDHVSKGYTNLCQLCRENPGKDRVLGIGMTGYQGRVRASKDWGGADEVMRLAPAFEGSHEFLLHTIARRRGDNVIGFAFQGSGQLVDKSAQELFGMDRVERFVGVSYKPEMELQSHYNICDLSQQFDFLIHVDHSTELRVV
jgi:erythromycin esterase-like protein